MSPEELGESVAGKVSAMVDNAVQETRKISYAEGEDDGKFEARAILKSEIWHMLSAKHDKACVGELSAQGAVDQDLAKMVTETIESIQQEMEIIFK